MEVEKSPAVEEDEEIVQLDEFFFVNRDYKITSFTFGSYVIEVLCLHSASTDYDLTGQLVWPGAVLLNNYLCKNEGILNERSVIELGSGVGITGILCSKFCREIVLTDHNDEVLEILKKNIELQESSSGPNAVSVLKAEKLEWGNSEQTALILEKYAAGFDLILGADICFQQFNIPLLFSTVKMVLERSQPECRFILAYMSRVKSIDEMVVSQARKLGMKVIEVPETRTVISNLQGVIFEISLP
ncbi:putative methyltransferase family protein [Wolffia australiana]